MVNQPQILTLKIPAKLAAQTLCMRTKVNTYETNRHIKNITAFIILKSVTPYGLIKNYKQQLQYLCDATQCERQTFKKRLQWLQDENLLTIEGDDIRLKSWKEVSTLYYINLEAFTTVIYDYKKDSNVWLRLFATEIETNKERQVYMIKTKLQRNLALKNKIQAAVLQHGGDVKRINDFTYLHNAMRLLFKKSFLAEPELHALLKQVRPDCNRSVHTIADAWTFKSPQSVSYYKALFVANNIATVHKGERITSQCRARNEHAHVLWNKHKKQTVLSLVDTISIICKNVAA